MTAGKTRVLFNAPVIEEIKPPTPAGRPTMLPYRDVQAIVAGLRFDGWDVRSVVTKRVMYTAGGTVGNTYEMSRPVNWGVIIDLRSTALAVSSTPYLPIKVQWVKDGTISEHWPEELLLLHKPIFQHEITTKLTEQMEDD